MLFCLATSGLSRVHCKRFGSLLLSGTHTQETQDGMWKEIDARPQRASNTRHNSSPKREARGGLLTGFWVVWLHAGVFGVGAGGAANSSMQPWGPLAPVSPPSASPSMYVCLAHARAHSRTQAPMDAPVPVTNAAPHRMQLHTSCTRVSLTHQLHTSCTPLSLTLDPLCPLSAAACVCLRVCNLC